MDIAGEGGKILSREAALVVTDCLSGPLFTGLSREDMVDDQRRFFPATFEGDSWIQESSE